ncbi:hypothetical protein V8B97DRAFT_1871274 [Scleroderma yunnanense]
MKGTILRQGFRMPPDELRSPCKLNEGPTKELGGTTIDHKQKSKIVLQEKDDASSTSYYESSSDSDDETDGDPVVAAATSQDDTVPVPRGSLFPPLSSNGRETREVHSSRAWYEFDLSVMVALASPVGNWLTGGDHVKNLFLILLLIFYLHQLIEVPWSLYQLSRPRRRAFSPPNQDASVEDHHCRLASSELRALELFYLTMTILSPLLGALFLRTIINSLSPASISWFSVSLFVLATGLRPWKHVIERLQERTIDLHDIVHYPPSDMEKAQSRLDLLSEKVAMLEAELKVTKVRLEAISAEIYEHVEVTYDAMDKATRRHEKKTEATKSALDTRLSRVEKDVEILLERREIRADTPPPTLLSVLKQHLNIILPASATGTSPAKSPTRSCQRSGLSRSSSIRLETIPEIATFQPNTPGLVSASFRIPGLGLVLRIGDLVTLPVRCIVTYLLSRLIYTRGRTPVA